MYVCIYVCLFVCMNVCMYMSVYPWQDYLKALNKCYEDWLGNEEHHSWHGNTPVLVCPSLQDMEIILVNVGNM